MNSVRSTDKVGLIPGPKDRVPTIRWHNGDISKFNPTSEKPKVKVRFPKDISFLKGVRLIYYPDSKRKFIHLNYKFKGKAKSISLGEFVPSVREKGHFEDKLNGLVRKHKGSNGRWKSDPALTYDEVVKTEMKDDVLVIKVIEDLCIAGFPKALMKDEFLSRFSMRTHINHLIGGNKRTRHLSYTEDKDGNGKIFFKPGGPQSFPELFKKYPPGVGVVPTQSGETSLYDSETGLKPIKGLTPTIIDQYLKSKDRSEGITQNILLAFQCLWTFACKQKAFGEDIPNNPTSRRDKRIILMKSRVSKAPGKKYNDRIFKEEDLPKLDQAFVQLSNQFPFQAEALNMMFCTGRRMEETLKMRWNMITEDEEGNPIILMPGSITKARRPAKVDITQPVQRVLDQLKKHLSGKYKGYKMVPYLFPTLRINKVKLAEHTYLNSDQTRIKNLEGCWSAIEELTGIEGSPKMFRKTYSTYGRDLVGEDDAMIVQDHLSKAVPRKSYWKTTNKKRKTISNKVATIFTFPRAINQ